MDKTSGCDLRKFKSLGKWGYHWAKIIFGKIQRTHGWLGH